MYIHIYFANSGRRCLVLFLFILAAAPLTLMSYLDKYLVQDIWLSVGGRNHICAKGGMGRLNELGEPSRLVAF